MTILELERYTELERATIRYYEKEGLIEPCRKENSYRDYSEYDANELLKIKLLRQLDLPISSIKQLQQGSGDIKQLLSQQADILAKQSATMIQAIAICNEICENASTYASLDAAHYLEKLKQAPSNAFLANVFRQDSCREYHPLRRFFARSIDYAIIQILIQFILIVVFRVRPVSDLLTNVIRYGVPFLAVPLTGLFLHYLQTTPGKWLMGIRLVTNYRKPYTIMDGMKREWEALRYGYGFGIPGWSIWRMYRSYKDYKNKIILEQDIGTEHMYDYFSHKKKVILAFACAALLIMNCVSAVDIIKPKHRGDDLTVAEFAENFNYYMSLLDENTSVRMAPDGTWTSKNSVSINHENAIYINLGGIPQNKTTYNFHLEGERLTGISYSNTWTDITAFWSFPKSLTVASITAVMSQHNTGFIDLINIAKQMDDALKKDHGDIHYENITIYWKIEATGCNGSTGSKYYPDQTSETSTVSLEFEIIIQ